VTSMRELGRKVFEGLTLDRDRIRYGICLTLRASKRMFSMNEFVKDYCYWHMQDLLSQICASSTSLL